jgi:syntaxin-binding protein 4
VQLHEKEQACSRAEEELLRIRRDAQGAIHETRALRSKIYLAQQAQKAAMSMEHDYEDVVRLLENEIAELKSQQAKQMVNVITFSGNID